MSEAELPETRSERLVRRGHRARLYMNAFIFVGLLALLIVLISANRADVKVSWAAGSTHASLVWVILASAVIGWLLGIATVAVFSFRSRRRR